MPRVGTEPSVLARALGAHAAIPALGLAAFDPHFRDVGGRAWHGCRGRRRASMFLAHLGVWVP